MLPKSIKAFFLCVTIFGAGYQICGQPKPVFKIEGEVLSRNNAAIAGVLVRAYRDNSLLPNPVRTDKNGYYSFSFQAGDTISLVRYDLTGWYPGKLESLSGAKHHLVNKVLIKLEETLSLADRQEIGSTLTRLVMLDRANGSTPDQFKAYYDPVVVAGFGYRTSGDPNWVAWKMDSPYKFEMYGYRTHKMPAYLDIKKGEAIRLNKKSLRISLEGENNFHGKPIAILVRDGATLHVWAVSADSRTRSESPEPYSLSEQYDDASEIQRVIFHGLEADLTAKITTAS